MELLRLLLAFLLAAVSTVTADDDAFVGVNIGTDLSDLPHPTQVVALLKAQNIRHIRLSIHEFNKLRIACRALLQQCVDKYLVPDSAIGVECSILVD
ncbi:hypothetical protein SAY86_031119 [Trapa natans]|uniref:Uncharacterized protein n=1 Tax=Trapa natans TaxID=22666 RepID=A0AAN7LYV9_TRANT|nr:hypothetical protein SAY86_031119 [Trapa natans]